MNKLKSIPASALWLGGTGALPFISLSFATLFTAGDLQAIYANALMLYGAIILSFLGGIHWGLAMAAEGAVNVAQVSPLRLGISVAPSLVGWGAVLLSNAIASAIILSAGFVVMLIIDVQAAKHIQVPSWYPKLRWPLTVIVVFSLLMPLVAI